MTTAATPDRAARSAPAPDPASPPTDATTASARVLVVVGGSDGSTLERILAEEGHSVTSVDSAEEALGLFLAMAFDVIVSEIELPGLSGTELLREIRDRSSAVPVILFTGTPDVDSAIAAVEHRAFRYLRKPFRAGELLEVVTRAYAQGRIAQAWEDRLVAAGAVDDGAEELEAQFERALDTLWIAYQPIIDRNWTIVGFEALLRCEESELRGPLEFLGAAERLGRVNELATRIRQAVTLPLEHRHELLFMNVDPSQLQGDAFAAEEDAFRQMGSRIVLEITERASAADIKGFEEKFWRLKEAGFQIAVDDMGTGYSGLTMFSQLEPEFVKLDGALIRGVPRSERKQKIIKSVASLCVDLGVSVIAEGVETQEEFEVLREMGCTHFQGFFVGRPAPLE